MKVIIKLLFLFLISALYVQAQNQTTVISGSEGQHICNDATTGTQLYTLTKLISSGCAALATTNDAVGSIFGVTVAGAGTSGIATVANFGIIPIQFDNTPTAGDYVIESSTTRGLVHDAGTNSAILTAPCIGQVENASPIIINAYTVYNVSWRNCNVGGSGGGGGGGGNTFSQILHTYSASNTPPSLGQINEQNTASPPYAWNLNLINSPPPPNTTFPSDFAYGTYQLVPDSVGYNVNISIASGVATVTLVSGTFTSIPAVGEYVEITGSTTSGVNTNISAITNVVTPTTTSFSYSTSAANGTAAGTITAYFYDTVQQGVQDASYINMVNGGPFNVAFNENASLSTLGVHTLTQLSSLSNALNFPSVQYLGCASGGVYPAYHGIILGALGSFPTNPLAVPNNTQAGISTIGYADLVLDSAVTPVVGDYVIPSPTICYEGIDSGVNSNSANYNTISATGAPVIGIISSYTTSGSGVITARLYLYLPGSAIVGGGSGGTGTVTSSSTSAQYGIPYFVSTGGSSPNYTAQLGQSPLTVNSSLTAITANNASLAAQGTALPAYFQLGTTNASLPSFSGGNLILTLNYALHGSSVTRWDLNCASPTLAGVISYTVASGVEELCYTPISSSSGTYIMMTDNTIPAVTTATNPCIVNGLITVSGCTSGGNTTTAAPQYNVPYYSNSGTANTLSGASITGPVCATSTGAPTSCTSPQLVTALNNSPSTTLSSSLLPTTNNVCTFQTIQTSTVSLGTTLASVVSGTIPASCVPASGILTVHYNCRPTMVTTGTVTLFFEFYDSATATEYILSASNASSSITSGTSTQFEGLAELLAPVSGTGILETYITEGFVSTAPAYSALGWPKALTVNGPTLATSSASNRIDIYGVSSVSGNSIQCNLAGHN